VCDGCAVCAPAAANGAAGFLLEQGWLSSCVLRYFSSYPGDALSVFQVRTPTEIRTSPAVSRAVRRCSLSLATRLSALPPVSLSLSRLGPAHSVSQGNRRVTANDATRRRPGCYSSMPSCASFTALRWRQPLLRAVSLRGADGLDGTPPACGTAAAPTARPCCCCCSSASLRARRGRTTTGMRAARSSDSAGSSHYCSCSCSQPSGS
jgi:hypothetical protein